MTKEQIRNEIKKTQENPDLTKKEKENIIDSLIAIEMIEVDAEIDKALLHFGIFGMILMSVLTLVKYSLLPLLLL